MSLCCSLVFSSNCRRTKIMSVVTLDFRKPHCISGQVNFEMYYTSWLSMIFASNFPAVERSVIPRLLPQSARSPFSTMLASFQSWVSFSNFQIWLIRRCRRCVRWKPCLRTSAGMLSGHGLLLFFRPLMAWRVSEKCGRMSSCGILDLTKRWSVQHSAPRITLVIKTSRLSTWCTMM